MSYRHKILLGVAAGLTGLLILLYVTSQAILLRSYAQLEAQDTRAHVARAYDALRDDIADLDRQASDWAGWDETYTFATGTNREYIKRNLPDESYVDLRLNLFAVTDLAGKIIYGGMYAPDAKKVRSLPASLLPHLTTRRLLRHPTPESHLEGILPLPEGPLLIASRPVLKTDRTGPIRGTLLMGRYLDAREVARLAGITHLTLKVDPIQAAPAQITPRLVPRALDGEPEASVRALSDLMIEGSVALPDLYGRPALVVRVESLRQIMAQGRGSIRYFLLWFSVVGLAFAGLAVTLFENVVLSRHRWRASEERYRALVQDATPLPTVALDREHRVQMWNRAAERAFGWTEAEVIDHPLPTVPPEAASDFQALCERVLRGEAAGSVEMPHQRRDGSRRDVSVSSAALRGDDGSLFGLTIVMADITERKQAEAQIRRQVEQLGALRTIDTAITGSLDLRVTLNVLLEQATARLGVDAADLLLHAPPSGELQYAAGRGFHTRALRYTRLRLGEGHAGRSALQRQVVIVQDLEENPGTLASAPLIRQEGFHFYACAPLTAKGQLRGVLEIFHRSPLHPDPEWLNFFEALAGQAAIAIDNASLFDHLQRTNLELIAAYDTTLEGWSKALDLRDEETEGHTQRVTELTMALATHLGVPDEELIHIRRGALLHDIGKMGIPDLILRKPGPLTEDEWTVMRKHPVYAYELLSAISYLRPALDIPHCHHEKWDGSGYPRGLKGDAIPLAARIFAVVDVWDALTSDRPYRKAWPKEKTRTFIQEQAGTHFDPDVVRVFLAQGQLSVTGPSLLPG